MSKNTTSNETQVDESEPEDMLEEYDFSHAKPGRYRGVFKKKLVRVLADGTERVIERKQTEEK